MISLSFSKVGKKADFFKFTLLTNWHIYAERGKKEGFEKNMLKSVTELVRM